MEVGGSVTGFRRFPTLVLTIVCAATNTVLLFHRGGCGQNVLLKLAKVVGESTSVCRLVELYQNSGSILTSPVSCLLVWETREVMKWKR